MLVNYFQYDKISFGSARATFVSPYKEGYNHWKAVFASADPQKRTFSSLQGRIAHAVLGILLLIPIINIIVDVAICYFSLPLPQKPQVTSGSEKPVVESQLDSKQLNEKEEIARIALKLTEHFQKIDEIYNEAVTPAIFNQQITELKKLGYDWKEIAWMVGKICDKVIESDDAILSRQKKAYIFHRLHSERSLEALTETLNQKKYQPFASMNVLTAPDDGNCFLWSCILGLEVMLSDYPITRFESLKSFNKKHDDYIGLKVKQQNLREALVKGFTESIVNKTEVGDAFRIDFCCYFLSTQSLKEQIELTEAEETGKPSDEMVQIFTEGLKQNGTWNGEFEARIVAQHLQRPIVILNQGDNSFRIIAGGQFMEINDPLIVQHTGNHYNTLIYAP